MHRLACVVARPKRCRNAKLKAGRMGNSYEDDERRKRQADLGYNALLDTHLQGFYSRCVSACGLARRCLSLLLCRRLPFVGWLVACGCWFLGDRRCCSLGMAVPLFLATPLRVWFLEHILALA
jgi:hypothetical protein